MFICVLVLSIFGVFSCVPPREPSEAKYIYNYQVGSYDYSLILEGEGKVSYFLFSFSGQLNIFADINLSVFDDKKGKMYVLTLKDVSFKSSMGIDDEVKRFLSKTNIMISFYMTEKGVKYPVSGNIVEKFLLDLVIPVLPETGSNNEIVYGNFGLTIGDISVNTEISNLVYVFSTNQKAFFIFTTNSLKSLELKDADIVVADIKGLGKGIVINNILENYELLIDSSTTIPIYMGSDTRVVGFKGKAKARFFLRNKI